MTATTTRRYGEPLPRRHLRPAPPRRRRHGDVKAKILGIANIQAHRQPLLQRLREGLPPLGFTPITSAGTTSALVTFTKPGAERLHAERLKQARVAVSLSGDRMRVSPSVFNTVEDVEVLLEALG